MGPTEKIAKYALDISFAALPKKVIHQAKRCFLDLIGVALSGSRQPIGRILLKIVRDFGGNPQATILGSGVRTDIMNTALVNGALAHALDYDDTHRHSMMHPSSPIIPAVLAIGEWKGLSGEEVLEAFLAGYEVQTRVGLGIGKGHYEKGWHATSTMGRFGAAVAAGKLLQLEPEKMLHAIGLAATQSSGLRAVFGTMAKPFHPGKAAYDGVLAAIMASKGFTCPPNILEGHNGFLQVMGENPKINSVLKTLGKKYLILDNTFKPYASCLLTHPVIYGLINLKNLHKIDYREIEAIECEVSSLCMDAAGQREPKTGFSAKFSVYFCAALALAEGEAGEDKFDNKWANDSRLVELTRKVRAFAKRDLKESEAKVTIFTKNGLKYAKFINRPKGDPQNPMRDDEIEKKFRTLAHPIISNQKIEKICQLVKNLEKVRNIRELIKMCF